MTLFPTYLTMSLLLASTLGWAQAPSEAAPRVTLDSVQEVFGDNLETKDRILSGFLLALGMERTSRTGAYQGEDVGVPYIIDRGPMFWVRQLSSDRSIDTLVNNAILLLFSEADIPNADVAARQLMTEASNMGYWPASYYLAEQNIKFLGQAEASIVTPLMMQSTIDLLADCAEASFAPCQYMAGFIMVRMDDLMGEGAKALRAAIATTLRDPRYEELVSNQYKAAIEVLSGNNDLVPTTTF